MRPRRHCQATPHPTPPPPVSPAMVVAPASPSYIPPAPQAALSARGPYTHRPCSSLSNLHFGEVTDPPRSLEPVCAARQPPGPRHHPSASLASLPAVPLLPSLKSLLSPDHPAEDSKSLHSPPHLQPCSCHFLTPRLLVMFLGHLCLWDTGSTWVGTLVPLLSGHT